MYLIYKQKFNLVIGCIVSLFFCISPAFGQTNPNAKTLEVTSWKKGTDQINTTVFNLNFRSEEFSYDLLTKDGIRKFRFSVEKQYIPTLDKLRYQCAVISLREVSPSSVSGGYNLGMNILLNGDQISSLTNVICPIESPSVLEQNIFPFKSARVFYVENFAIKIVPTEFNYDNNYNLLINLNLTVEFSNKDSVSK